MIDKIITLLEYLSEHHHELVTGEDDFNYDGWACFVTFDGRRWLGNYLNEFGL